jgi:hypothetical protein
MASVQERIQNIKNCAEEKSQLQTSCLKEVDLGSIKNKKLLAKARYHYELCEKKNLDNYPCLSKRESIKYSF